MKDFARILGLIALLAIGAGCADDNVKSEGSGSSQCAEGESWNPILAQCEPTGFNNADNADPGNSVANNSSGNSNTGNGATNNSSDLDAGVGNNNSMDDTGFDEPDLPCGVGSMIGRACAPSGDILAAADVSITGTDCDGNSFEVTTRTTGDGTFEFDEVPSGTHDLTVTSGSFSTTKSVFIRAGILNDYTAASEKVCVDADVKLAVIKGAYDSVEDVLESLNLSYDVKGGDEMESETQAAIDFLSNATAMSEYDVVLINCGNLYNQMKPIDVFGQLIYPFGDQFPAITAALQQFVAQGGSLYTSDWASPFFEMAFPDIIDFYGDDTDMEAARNGYAPQLIQATVQSQTLQTTLGANSASIDFPHTPPAVYNDHWVVAESVDPSATVHLSGDAQLCQNDACQSGGAMQSGAPLLVSKTEAGGGTVIFTSFHNHSDDAAPISAETETILRFLILQL